MQLCVPGKLKSVKKGEFVWLVRRWSWDAYLLYIHGEHEAFTLNDLVNGRWQWNGPTKMAAITNLTRQGQGKYELEDEPWHTPELSAYATTNVALALVGAIEQRLALKRTLMEALRLRDEARSALDLHELLLTCSTAEQQLRKFP